MNAEFITTVNFFDKKIQIAELLVKDYKCVLKALISAESNPQDLFTLIKKILLLRTSVTEDEIDNFNFLELLYLLVILRVNSGNNIVTLDFESKDNISSKLHLSLDKIGEEICNVIQTLQNNKHIDEDFIIQYNLPTVIDLQNQNDLYISCIKNITFKNHSVNFTTTSTNLKHAIIKKIPLHIYKKLVKKIQTDIDRIQNIDLLSRYKIPDFHLFLALNTSCVIWVIKLLFYENLMNIYQSIFVLCKYVNLSPDYIENLSIGELGVYTKMFEAFLHQKTTTSNNTNNEQSLHSKPINEIE